MSESNKDILPFDELKSNISELVSPIANLKVDSFQSSQRAIDVAKNVKSFSKRIEDLRKQLVEPLNQRVKAINEYAKSISAPLTDAEAHIKNQLVVFEREQEKIREVERRRAEEEAERKRQELLAKQEAERKAFQEKQAAIAESASIFGDDTASVKAAQEEARRLEERQVEEKAKQDSEALQKQWDIEQHSIKNAKKVWKCEALDLNLVPREYLLIELNEKAILSMARGGVTNIPGVRVWQETTVAIGANTYVPRTALNGR